MKIRTFLFGLAAVAVVACGQTPEEKVAAYDAAHDAMMEEYKTMMDSLSADQTAAEAYYNDFVEQYIDFNLEAAKKNADNEVAVKRAEVIEMLQSDVMDAYNASFIGKDLEILVDGYDEEFEQFFGRTYADSPDIDGRVWLASEEPLREGTFVKACIDGCVDGDLSGYVLEEDEV